MATSWNDANLQQSPAPAHRAAPQHVSRTCSQSPLGVCAAPLVRLPDGDGGLPAAADAAAALPLSASLVRPGREMGAARAGVLRPELGVGARRPAGLAAGRPAVGLPLPLRGCRLGERRVALGERRGEAVVAAAAAVEVIGSGLPRARGGDGLSGGRRGARMAGGAGALLPCTGGPGEAAGGGGAAERLGAGAAARGAGGVAEGGLRGGGAVLGAG